MSEKNVINCNISEPYFMSIFNSLDMNEIEIVEVIESTPNTKEVIHQKQNLINARKEYFDAKAKLYEEESKLFDLQHPKSKP